MRIRPKSDYLKQAGWEELYVLSGHWKSDMDFYSDELNFLSNLLNRYSMWLTENDNIRRVEKVKLKLSVLQEFKNDLIHCVLKHMRHLKDLMENPFSYDEIIFRNEHAELEDDFADFIKAHRTLKREVFSLTSSIVESENINNLLHGG
ncbi:hypothetical protein C900_01974 [Fulvivirga imtechensis AK7]|uniref:Uncharacterized protein n=2 Tax=Fulvivirga TaxID=396811 RepID=L8JWI4_9BACT|nr:hypothetical protein C900_01974 [Fulvivirga imtechensis AK7]